MFYLELLALFLLLFILYETSTSLKYVKYYVKFGIYYGGVIFNSFLLFPYLLTRPTNVLNLLYDKLEYFIYISVKAIEPISI